MNENMDDLPARDSAHGPRDGLDFAHGPHHGLDSANSPLAGPPRPAETGRGSTVRGQTLIHRLQEDREAQLRRQRMPRRKGSAPTEDGSRDPHTRSSRDHITAADSSRSDSSKGFDAISIRQQQQRSEEKS